MTRIKWSDETKQELAVETARILETSPIKLSPFRAFQQAQKNILPKKIQRNVVAISQVSWLLELMKAGKIPAASKQEESQTRPKLPAEPNPSPVILEAIHTLKELAHTQAEAILELGLEMRRLRESLEKYESTPPPAPVTKPPIVIRREEVKRVIIAGVNTGKQRDAIMQKIKDFTNLNVQFIDTHRKYTEIPKFDHLLVMSWTPHVWQVEAQRAYRDRMHVVRGIKDIITRCSMI